MSLGSAVLLSAVLTLAPLEPVRSVDLSSHGVIASDVTWLDDQHVLVGLMKGGVVRVSLRDGTSTLWLQQGEHPQGVPDAELLDSDGDLVVITSGGRKNTMVRRADGSYVSSRSGGGLYTRGVAMAGGSIFCLGWVTATSTDEDQQGGALWRQATDGKIAPRPVHRIVSGGEAVTRWRRTMHPYGGSVVALPDQSVAVMTSAEPGIYRYGRDGKLLEVLASGVRSLVLDSAHLLEQYATDVVGRYRNVFARQPLIDDLVVTPEGLAILARTVAQGRIHWQLWRAGRTDITSIQQLEPGAFGPIGHMKCESRGTRLACVTNMPTAEEAGDPRRAGSKPTLLLYDLKK